MFVGNMGRECNVVDADDDYDDGNVDVQWKNGFDAMMMMMFMVMIIFGYNVRNLYVQNVVDKWLGYRTSAMA